MHVRCPHCHNPIEIVDQESSFRGIPCPTCGSSFSLAVEGNETLSASSLPKRTIAHFDLVEKLGSGAFGTVWKARDTQLDRTVAVKVPRNEFTAADADSFIKEARAAAQVSHSNIVSVHEVGLHDDRPYIVSEFVDGLPLSSWLTGQRLTVRTAVELAAKIADALHVAHENGVVHRDLKPSNHAGS